MIRIGSLFSGVGMLDFGVECALTEAAVPCETVFQIEFDEFCRAVLEKHWPNANRSVCDVTERRRIGELPAVDLLVGGFPCFPAGTLVDAAEGYRPIESLKVDDLVRTHLGRLRRVTQTMERDGAPIVEVRVLGAPPIETTEEHPFWARRLRYGKRPHRTAPPARTWDPPQWVSAKDLGRGWYVCQPLDVPGEARRVWESSAFWYLVGRWLGDGWIVNHRRKSRVPKGQRGSRANSRVWKAIICCAHDEADELAGKIAEAGYHATRVDDRTAVKFHISSQALVEFLAPFGRGASGKCVPGFVFGAPARVLRALWSGWIESDGCARPHGAVGGSTVSKSLALGMARVARTAHGRAVAVHRNKRQSEAVIEVRLSRSNKEAFVEGRSCWVPVRSVRSSGRVAKVHNISVEQDNTYIADSVAVHNCTDVSSAGKGEGLAGAQSGLWYSYRDVVEDRRPSVVLIENVASGKGRYLCEVRTNLHELGYRTRVVQVGAWEVGAPHRRERVFIVAWRGDIFGDFFRDDTALGVGQCADSECGVVWEQPWRGGRSSGAGEVQPGVARAAGGDGAVGDPDGAGLQVRQDGRGGEGQQLAPAVGAGLLVDAFGEGRPRTDGARVRGAEREVATSERSALGDSEGARRGRGCGRPDGEQRGRSQFAHAGGCGAEPGLGRGDDGTSDRLDAGGPGLLEVDDVEKERHLYLLLDELFCAGEGVPELRRALPDRWPAGRGQPQHSWEPPRVIATLPKGGGRLPQDHPFVVAARNRRRRLKALGNGCVPAQVAVPVRGLVVPLLRVLLAKWGGC